MRSKDWGDLALTRDQQIQVRILQIEPLTEVEVRQCSLGEVDPAPQVDLMLYQVLKSTFFSCLQQQRHQHIGDGM